MIKPGEKKFLCFFPNKTSRKNRWVSAPGRCFCFVSIKHLHRRGMNDSIYYLHRHNHEYNATVAVIIITVIRSESASTSCIEGDDIFSNDINSQLVDTLTRALLFPHTLSHISTLTRLDNNADDLNWWHARMHTNRQMLIQTRTLHHTADSSTHAHMHAHTLPDVRWWQLWLVKGSTGELTGHRLISRGWSEVWQVFYCFLTFYS